jgi:hypothetical protein
MPDGVRSQRVQGAALLVGADLGCSVVEILGLEPTTPCSQSGIGQKLLPAETVNSTGLGPDGVVRE